MIEVGITVLGFIYCFERFIRIVERGRFNVKVIHLHVADVPLDKVEEYDGGRPTEEHIKEHIKEVNQKNNAPQKVRSPFGGNVTIKRRT